MITRIELRNYRIFKYISQPFESFQVLVGANATGKTTFLDAISFVSDIVSKGIDSAVNERSTNFNDLTWCGLGGDIEIALEFALPSQIIEHLGENSNCNTIRYELKIGIHDKNQDIAILGERALLLDRTSIQDRFSEITLFPHFEKNEELVYNKAFSSENAFHLKIVLNKKVDGNDTFLPETEKNNNELLLTFKLGYRKSALANLPADEEKFPASVWLKEYLNTGVQVFMLNSLKIREASKPGQGKQFKPDGSNLPWVIDDFKKQYPNKFERWIKHIRTALPDVADIKIVELPDNKFKYLKIIYDSGFEAPSWVVSDGTLQLLALTIIAYLPDFKGIYLIEEPENGIHPKAIETVFQSLSSVYDAQILVASHSSILLGVTELSSVLCFGKTTDGIASIVKGNEHPMLKQWKGETNLSILFAGGIL